MTIFYLTAVLLVLVAVIGFVNEKTMRRPLPIVLMAMGMLFSIGITVGDAIGIPFVGEGGGGFISSIDFNTTLMIGMLGALLYAGAQHMNLNDLGEKWMEILLFSTIGILMSTFLVGMAMFTVLIFLGIEMPLIYCFLFGSLISPTDPIAVVGILKKAGVSKGLQTKTVGESLFNDGVGIVLFLVLLGQVPDSGHHGHAESSGALSLFAQEVIGGVGLGFVVGFIGYQALKNLDNYKVEIMITLAMVVGGYALATAMHFSGALAMVVAGLMIGNHGRQFAMSKKTKEHLDTFWEMVDEILNAILFLLIGLEVLIVEFTPVTVLAGGIAIVMTLLARFISVGLPVSVMRGAGRSFSPGVVRIMTWGGLRGGISVALALSLPEGSERDLILTMTYIVVAFSILVQGLSVGPLAKRITARHAAAPGTES